MSTATGDRTLLTDIYNSVQTGIENLAVKFRNKTDDMIETMLGITIDGLCDNNLKNRVYMERLMRINAVENEFTLNNIGNDAVMGGDSGQINQSRTLHPTYAESVNYVDNYIKYKNDEKTRESQTSTQFRDYANHNEIYTQRTNLVPDDLDALTGTYSSKVWRYGNQRSILTKTKKLFAQGKINTIISRFCTGGDGNDYKGVTDSGDIVTQYGMSHGRNLLLKEAENGTGQYNINGYNNPYCRVWTHHYQYDRLDKLIRPFVAVTGERGDKNIGQPISKKEFHNWTQFMKSENDTVEPFWKNDNEGWAYSVLHDNGFVNIAPKYDPDESKKIHTKQCMFSIENLAWKGYDPYSFEKALSWEQRGPMGGRIMWFPPYGISFNETTQANWTNHTFIGRGEDVYTYTNTVRSGTLNFMMVVDHPSIIDYVSWQEGINDTVKDTDLLRFFAGCDSGTLIDAAKPTPLTDEYIQASTTTYYTKAEKAPLPQPKIEEEIPEEISEIVFYVFYPNNYSGCYDHMGRNVEAIAYLLNGLNAQKVGDGDNYQNDVSLTLSNITQFDGNGYEMGNGYVTDKTKTSTGCIYGTTITWQQAINKGTKNYPVNKDREWWYRIDGEYSVPKQSDKNKNTYDQRLVIPKNYEDNSDESLNKNAEKVKGLFTEESENENLYSLAEVAAAIGDENVKQFLISKGVNEERVNTLSGIIDNYEFESINGIGYSNSHGNNASKKTNDDRNYILAEERINTVVDWFSDQYQKRKSKEIPVGDKQVVNISSESDVKITTTDVSYKEAKKYRSARMVVKLKKTSTTKLSETSQTTTDGDTTYSQGRQKYIGFSEKKDSNNKTYYVDDKTGKAWVEVTDENSSHYGELMMVDLSNGVITDYTAENTTEQSRNDNGETNKIRYDQEYHFFKILKQSDPIVFSKLMDKIKYFDPAFHSMTPEGFNGRLTFLQQCTRQGNTIGASDPDTDVSTASNLAFGRPPFCVLRLGDFYNQMIVIDNISINYDPLTWDLNIEGIGVQPLLANITISFKFIGGGDMTGPVRRLQNAMTFNYYANARLYDNRADRITYPNDSKLQGAIDSEPLYDKSYMYLTENYKGDTNGIRNNETQIN